MVFNKDLSKWYKKTLDQLNIGQYYIEITKFLIIFSFGVNAQYVINIAKNFMFLHEQKII